MNQFEAIKAAITAKGVTIKESRKTLTVFAPGYSSHSAFLDAAFDIARSLGIKYRGYGHSFGETYHVKFSIK